MTRFSETAFSLDDARLIAAYRLCGRRFFDLAYSDEFEEIVKQLGLPKTDASRQAVYRRLWQLSEAGRLPLLEKKRSC